MRMSLLLLLLTFPLYNVGISVGNRFVSVTNIISLVVAITFLSNYLLSKAWERDGIWVKYFLLFLMIVLLGMAFSSYGLLIVEKGSIQIISMITMVVVSLAISRYIRVKNINFIYIIRILIIVLGIYAAIGVLQFIFWNMLSLVDVLNFNDICSCWAWKSPKLTGDYYRITSISSEPTHMAVVLSVVIGISFIRIGGAGREYSRVISNIVPQWSAISVLLAVLLSMSINAYILSVVIFISVGIFSGRLKSVVTAGVMVVIGAVMVLVAILPGSDGEIDRKIKSILLLTKYKTITSYRTEEVSAIALTSNMEVMESNIGENIILGGGIGSHPLAYKKYAPGYIYNDDNPLRGLNSQGASSLLIRLLSETGLLGTLTFILFIGIIIKRAMKSLKYEVVNDKYYVLSIGILSSFVGVVIIYLIRVGHYYDVAFWLPLGISASIPIIIGNSEIDRSGYTK